MRNQGLGRTRPDAPPRRRTRLGVAARRRGPDHRLGHELPRLEGLRGQARHRRLRCAGREALQRACSGNGDIRLRLRRLTRADPRPSRASGYPIATATGTLAPGSRPRNRRRKRPPPLLTAPAPQLRGVGRIKFAVSEVFSCVGTANRGY